MKKSLLLFVCLLIGTAAAWAQGTLSTANPNPIPQSYNGSLTITGTGTNWSNCTGGINLKLTNVSNGTVYNFGAAPSGAGWAPGYNGMPATTATGNITLPPNAPIGPYNVELRGYNGDNWQQNMLITANSFVSIAGSIGYFQGKVVMDRDSNCIYNGLDSGVPNVLITATPGPFYGITDALGNFNIPLPLGTYTFSAPFPPGGTMICPISPYTQTATVSTQGASSSAINFFAKPDHVADISSSLVLGNHRPGFWNNYVQVEASNLTTVPVSNAVVKLVKPSNFTLNTSYPAATSVNGDTVTWAIGTMNPGTSVSFYQYVTVPIGTPLNTPYTYTSILTSSATENNYANNTDVKTGYIVGSYDPNDKQVWTSTGQNANGFITPTDTLLRYLIRFQNTGTDTAFNITIRDTFDTDFDMSTLRVLGSSHPSVTQFSDSTGRRAKFVFANILLLDSNHNEQLSHGWIEYTIRKKNALANGTVLSNRASIYFDFNSPVRTNQVNSTICPLLGTAFTYTTNALAATLHGPTTGGATAWVWNFGDGQTGTGANPVHTYATGGTYTVCVTVTNACGRSQQICQSVTTACNPMNAGFSSTQGGGYTMTFSNSSTGTITGYAWNFGDGLTSNATNPTHTYALPGIYNVCLVITNACADHDTICNTVNVTCPAMNAGFTYTVTGNHVAFSNQSTGSYASVTWLFGDGGTTAAVNPGYNFLVPGLYNVCLILTNACGTHDTSCIAIPVGCTALGAAFSMSNALNTYNFSDLSAGTNLSYSWDFGDGGTATQASPTHTYYSVGSFQACLTVTDACQSTAALCSTVVITCATPQTAFNSTSPGLTVNFTDVSSNNPTSWAWDFGDGGTSTVASPVHTFPAFGIYAVCLTTSNACGPDTHCDSLNVVAVGVPQAQSLQVKLAPNPASNRVQLQLLQAQLQDVQFIMLDALGRMVEQWNVASIDGDYAREIDLSAYSEGIYFLHIAAPNMSRSLRVIVQR